jgi:hypothetical protein
MRKHFLLLFLMALLPLAGWAADLTVGLTTLSKTWGDADPVHPTTAQFTFNGTSAQKAALVNYLTFTRVDAGTDVGSYAYTWTLNPAYKTSGSFNDDDVFIGTPNGVLNITAKDISAAAFTVTLDALSYTYTGTAVEPTITSLKIGELVIASADYDVTFTNNTGHGTGNMTITGKNNLTGSQADVKEFTIVGGMSLEGKTATYAGDALTYTGLAQTPTNFTIEGLTYGTHFEVKAGSYQNNTAAGENTASVVLKGKGDYAENSEITATFSIAKAPATITPDAKSKSFGAVEPAFTATVVGARNGEELVYTIKRKDFGDVAHEQVDTYSEALYVEYDAENDVNKNYTITTGKANFTINKKAMTASGISYQIADQVYDVTKAASDKGITTTYTLQCKYAALDPVQYYTLEAGTDFTVTYINNTAVGVATVTFKGAGTKFYSNTTKDQTFTITAKPVTITAKVEPATVGYGAEYTPSVTWGGATDADIDALGAITYSYKENNGGAEGADVANPSAVGKYFVYATLAANTNYSVTATKGQFEITNGDLQAKVGVADVTYGVAPTFSIVPFEDGTSFPTGSAVTAGATYVVKNADTKETMACDLNKLPVGNYTVTNTATATNYNVVVAAGTFEVSARALTDALIAVVALDAKPYVGAKVENPSTTGKVTFTYPGTTDTYTLDEDDYTVSNEGFANINAGATAGSIKLIAKDGSNFKGEKTVNFEIKKATLNIKANDATWEYGTAENPATRYSATYTLLGQDADKDLTTAQDGFHGLLKVKRVVGETVGTYTNGLEVSFEDAGGNAVALADVADNYTIVPATGKLTIAPSTITLVVDNKVGVYGDPVAGFASTLSLSTAEGDNTTLTDLQKEQWATFVDTTGVAYTLAAAEGGKYLVDEEYAISATGATSTNYNVGIRAGKYTVTKRAIEITANDQTIPQGGVIDQTDYIVSSGALGYPSDVLGVTLSTDKTAVGVYENEIEPKATNPNYSYTYTKGKLTITGATAITLTRVAKANIDNATVAQLIKDYDGQENVDVTIKFNDPGYNTLKPNKWYAFILPFETDAKTISNAFGYGIVDLLNTGNTDTHKTVFSLKMNTDKIPANTPFIVKVWDTVDMTTGVTFDDVKIEAPATYDEIVVSDAAGNQFIGSYTGISGLGAYKPEYSGHVLWWSLNQASENDNDARPASDTGYLRQMSAFSYVPKDVAAHEFIIEEFGGGTTVIKGINFENAQEINTEGWYNLNGVKLQGAPTEKGVYIQNGKKIVIK